MIDTIGSIFRFAVVLLGFVAMWSLWDARSKRVDKWTSKMKDIWLCHILFIGCCVQGNIELLYRGSVRPTLSIFVVIFIMIWTIKGSFNGVMYTKESK